MTKRIPIWFDIDGTLLHTRAGHDAFRDALYDVYGWKESMESVVFAGNTDLQVLMDLSLIHGGSPDAGFSEKHAFFKRMAHWLDQGLQLDKPKVIPGAKQLVEALSNESDVLLGLLTGNARDCAFIKLKHVELHEAFSDGGFGDEHADRNILAELARKGMADALPGDQQLTSGWVIGDTPRDVNAAKRVGARCLGVASGAYSQTELYECGATEVVPDLSDTQQILEWLLDGK